MSAGDLGEEEVAPPLFRPFTRESLAAIEAKLTEERARKKGEAEHQVGLNRYLCFIILPFVTCTFEAKYLTVADINNILKK